MSAPRLVVLDAGSLVAAEVYRSPTWDTWPVVPPLTSNPAADCVGVTVSQPQWGLTTSATILEQVWDALVQVWHLDETLASAYVGALRDVAVMSAGGVFQPTSPKPFGAEVPADLAAVAHLAQWLDADAVVVQRPRAPLQEGSWDGRWVVDPRGFARKAPFISR